MKLTISIVFIVTMISSALLGQSNKAEDCYEIKYLDFWSLEELGELPKWREGEIDTLLLTINKVKSKDQSRSKFLMPLMMYQLKKAHPYCVEHVDTAYINRISQLYFTIRNIKFPYRSKFSEDKIDYIRDDFYLQVKDPECLSDMIFTFDDGPFYGKEIKEKISLSNSQTKQTSFGSLSISRLDNVAVLIARDNNDNVIWQKKIIDISNEGIPSLRFIEKNSIKNTSLGVIVYLHSERERTTIYLKPNGEFMFYYNSW